MLKTIKWTSCEDVAPSTVSAFAVNCRHIKMVVRIRTYWLWNKIYYRTSTKVILRLRHLLSYLGALPWVHGREVSIFEDCYSLYRNNQFPKTGQSSAKERGAPTRILLWHLRLRVIISNTLSSGRYFKYTVTFVDVSVPLILLPVDTSTECGPHSNLNFVQFVGKYFDIFSFRKHAITAFPPESPSVLYPKHQGTESGGWTSNSLSYVYNLL